MSGETSKKINPKIWKEIGKDLKRIDKLVVEKPAHAVLTLCQALAHKKHGHKYDHKQAGEWALKNLPKRFHAMIDSALISLAGDYDDIIEETDGLITFAEYVLNELEIVGEI